MKMKKKCSTKQIRTNQIRKIHAAKEKKRTHVLNAAYKELQKCIPDLENLPPKQITKKLILDLGIQYIAKLQGMLAAADEVPVQGDSLEGQENKPASQN